MSRNNINKAIDYVIQIYSNKYNCSIEQAKNIVNSSTFCALLKLFLDYMLHYSLEYWVRDIYLEQIKLNEEFY